MQAEGRSAPKSLAEEHVDELGLDMGADPEEVVEVLVDQDGLPHQRAQHQNRYQNRCEPDGASSANPVHSPHDIAAKHDRCRTQRPPLPAASRADSIVQDGHCANRANRGHKWMIAHLRPSPWVDDRSPVSLRPPSWRRSPPKLTNTSAAAVLEMAQHPTEEDREGELQDVVQDLDPGGLDHRRLVARP